MLTMHYTEGTEAANQPEQQMAHTAIICTRDTSLTVYVDFKNADSTVYYTYDRGQGDEPERESTPFQGADMPRSEQKAANIVNDWLDDQE